MLGYTISTICTSAMTESANKLDQQIAAAEAKLARLRERSRKLENGQKFVLGGLLYSAALHQPEIRRWLLAEAGKVVTRPADAKRLAPLLAQLAAIDAKPAKP